MDERDLTRLFVRYRDAADAGALGRVFDATAPALLQVARHLARDAASAEDLVQQTFLTAIARAESFRDSGRVRPWLAGILYRHARAEWRRRAALRERRPVAAESPSAFDAAARGETGERVGAALASLPSPYREVVAERLSSESPPREIARVLGRAPALVRLQLHRGLSRLRELLGRRDAAPALVAFVRAPRGIDVVRDAVLANAASASALPAALVAGGIVVTKKLVAAGVAAIALIAGVAWIARVEVGEAPVVAPVAAIAAVETPALGSTEKPAAPAALEAATRDSIDDISSPLAPVGPPVPVDRFVIHGRVVASEDRAPIAGATLTVFAYPDRVFGRGETDGDGRFRMDMFSTMYVSNARLVIDSHGHARTEVELDERLSGAKRVVDGFDIGTIELELGEVVEGIVLGPDDRPVAAAVVFVASDTTADLLNTARPVAVADGDGRFRAEHVLPLSSTGVAPVPFFALCDRGVARTDVRILRGMKTVTGVVLRVPPPASLDVHVVDGSGDPIPRARVTAEPRYDLLVDRRLSGDAEDRGDSSPEPAHGAELGPFAEHFRAVCDESGVARFRRLTARDGRGKAAAHDLVVEAQGYVTRFEDGIELDAMPREVTVELTPLRLRRIEGVVLQADGRPSADTRVRVFATTGRDRHSEYPSARTDIAGRFEIDRLRPEPEWSVYAGPDDGTGANATVSFDPYSEDEVETVELRLQRWWTLRGRLLDQFDTPVAFEFIEHVEPVRPDGRNVMVKTDADGAFVLGVLEPGRHVLVGSNLQIPPGRWANPHVLWTVDTETPDQVLRIERVVAGTCRLTVDVRDAFDGTPLAIDSAYLNPGDPETGKREPYSRSGALAVGRAEFEEVHAGSWNLHVGVAGRGDVARAIEIPAGVAEHAERIDVERLGRVRFFVDFGASGARECHVFFDRDVPNFGRHRDLAPGERVELDLLPGPLELRADSRFIRGVAKVEVKSGQTIDVTIPAWVGGEVMTQGCAQLPNGNYGLLISEDGVRWGVAAGLQLDTGETREATATVPAGRGWWRVARIEGGTTRDYGKLPAIAEGAYSVGAGETVRAVVPKP